MCCLLLSTQNKVISPRTGGTELSNTAAGSIDVNVDPTKTKVTAFEALFFIGCHFWNNGVSTKMVLTLGWLWDPSVCVEVWMRKDDQQKCNLITLWPNAIQSFSPLPWMCRFESKVPYFLQVPKCWERWLHILFTEQIKPKYLSIKVKTKQNVRTSRPHSLVHGVHREFEQPLEYQDTQHLHTWLYLSHNFTIRNHETFQIGFIWRLGTTARV